VLQGVVLAAVPGDAEVGIGGGVVGVVRFDRGVAAVAAGQGDQGPTSDRVAGADAEADAVVATMVVREWFLRAATGADFRVGSHNGAL